MSENPEKPIKMGIETLTTEELMEKLAIKKKKASERQRKFREEQKVKNPNYYKERAEYQKNLRNKEKEIYTKAKNKPVNDIKNAEKEANDTNKINDITPVLNQNDIKKQPLTSEGNIIKKGMIYIIEHNSNPTLIYVGKTTDGLNKRWNGHLSSFKQFNKMYNRLYFYVNYYGNENFSIREYKIYNNITPEYLDEEEKKYIFEMGTLNTQYSNNDITIKITNDLRNELLNRLITKDTCISKLYKLIDTFSYDYKRDVLDFSVNDENKVLLNNLLKKELTDKLIDTDIQALESTLIYTLSSKFLKNEHIIEDYIKYIDYFHKEFIITNNKEDTYNPDKLVNILNKYGDRNELFDWYLIIDFTKILQHYFNILNKSYDNVKIDLKNNIIYGIKSTPLLFDSDGEDDSDLEY
jgi:hypothetical protein